MFTLVNVSPAQSSSVHSSSHSSQDCLLPQGQLAHSHSSSASPAGSNAADKNALGNRVAKGGAAEGALSEHVHSEESLRQILNRLSRLEGHIRGVKTMVQEHRPCPDVLIQVAAVRGGLDKVARMILDEHLSQCISRAVAEGNIESEVEALRKALDRFIS